LALTLTYKILKSHLVEGELQPGREICIRIDQTLTQDATGTTAFLLFESMGADRVRTDLSVSYVDHNVAGFGPENHNDHLYLQAIAARAGVYHCRPGTGICHQVHLERFARPGCTLVGSDSHTPTAGGMGCLAVGAGGLDVAAAMAAGLFYLTCPKVLGVRLTGRLPDWVAAKDVILKLLSILTTRGNVGWVVEYFGPGVAGLSVPQRATITNMGAELGVTTSIFPSDEQTRRFLTAQARADHFKPLAGDDQAPYDRVVEINLSELEPLAACPSSPDNVAPVRDIAGIDIGQVAIGSCTNSSYADLMTTAAILRGKRAHSSLELAVSPGSRQVLNMLATNGALADLLAAGARILEAACGPCIGLGFSPGHDLVSLRTFNRNFAGRSGTRPDRVYLVSCETAAASALTGRITDPRDLPGLFGISYRRIELPERFTINDNMIEPPLDRDQAAEATVPHPATIVPPQMPPPLAQQLEGVVLLKCGDKITTDHIMPAGRFLKFRSNVPKYAAFVFNCFNKPGEPTFADRAAELKRTGKAGIVVAGESYGQGSSREHAALCPMHLGVRVVIARSIERIHKANLINYCIVPLEFESPEDYERISQGHELVIEDLLAAIESSDTVRVAEKTGSYEFVARLVLSPRQRRILLAGGLLSFIRGRTDG